jgi:hypothetical protein
MKLTNIFQQTSEMPKDVRSTKRWFFGFAAVHIIWMGWMYAASPERPELVWAIVWVLYLWGTGMAGFYLNRWFFLPDYGDKKIRAQYVGSLFGLGAVLPLAGVLFRRNILVFFLVLALGTGFCLLSYSIAGSLGRKKRDKVRDI